MNTLLLVVFVALLTLVQAAFAIPADSLAEATHSRFTVQEVEVVGKTFIRREADEYRVVSTLSREEIAALPVSTIADVLLYLPGLDIRNRGANGAQTDLSFRGGTFDQVLVMLNGVPVNDAQTGHYSLHLPLSTLLIEAIEVLQNVSSSTSGIHAYSGAVNIVTRTPNSELATIRLSAGMNAYAHPEVALSLAAGNGWQINASADYSRTDGYYALDPSAKEAEALANNDNRLANIYLQTRWNNRTTPQATSWDDLDIQAAAQYKDAGAGLFYGGSTDQFDATRTAFGSASYKHHWGEWSLNAQVAYRANYDRYEWHRSQRLYGNFHFAQNASAALSAAYDSWLGTTTAGLEFRNENIHSTNLGDTIYPNGQVPNVDGFNLADLDVLHLVKGANRMNVTYYAQQTFHYDRLNASVGISGIYNSHFGNHVTGGANIGYEYLSGSTNENGNGSVYLNAQRVVRMPTFTDLYYNAGNQIGDPNLKPERAWNFSAGMNYKYGMLHLAADVWYRLGMNTIDWIFVPTDTKRPYHAMNQQRINSAGTEFSAIYRPVDYSAAAGSKFNEWLRMVKLSYAYTWLDLDLHSAQSRYLDYLSHKLVLGLEHGIWVSSDPQRIGVIAASWTLRWQKREGDYTTAEAAADGSPIIMPYQPVLLLDGAIYYQNQRVKLSAECTNMTNRHYYDYGSLLMPGAWGILSLEVRFK